MALPEVEVMTGIALAGMSHRTFLHTHDDVERSVEMAIAESVLSQRHRYSEQRRQALAGEIGNRVGSIVGRAMQNLARAFRG